MTRILHLAICCTAPRIFVPHIQLVEQRIIIQTSVNTNQRGHFLDRKSTLARSTKETVDY
jgi:hypothetical protein